MQSGNSFGSNSTAPQAAIPGFLQFLFGNSGAPYEKANEAYQPYNQQARNVQNPFYRAGTSALPQFQDWLTGMKDPSAFINKLMGGYAESPMARNLQQASMRAGTNAASADGTVGSTPFAEQMQQNAGQISSMDQNNWLKNVLGINTEYGAGLDRQIGYGQHSADALSKLFGDAGEYAGGSAYGEQYGKNQDKNALWASIAKLFGG